MNYFKETDNNATELASETGASNWLNALPVAGRTSF